MVGPPVLDAQTTEQLRGIFSAFAGFGSRQAVSEMDGAKFSKLFKDTKAFTKTFTPTDADLIFAKIKTKGERKIGFTAFLTGLEHVAVKKGVSTEALAHSLISAGGPVDNGTKAEAVRFHDDKSLYTGVYANGGPTNVDGERTLKGLCDRSAADVRGVKKTGNF